MSIKLGAQSLIVSAVRVLCGCDAKLVRHRAVCSVETLEPRIAVDEVEALARGRAERIDDEVHAVRVPADRGVERALRGAERGYQKESAEGGRATKTHGPDLSVGRELEGPLRKSMSVSK